MRGIVASVESRALLPKLWEYSLPHARPNQPGHQNCAYPPSPPLKLSSPHFSFSDVGDICDRTTLLSIPTPADAKHHSELPQSFVCVVRRQGTNRGDDDPDHARAGPYPLGTNEVEDRRAKRGMGGEGDTGHSCWGNVASVEAEE